MMIKRFIVSLLFLLFTTSSLWSQDTTPSKLTILWHSGILGERLQQLAREYTAKTRVPVEVKLVAWEEWYDTIADQFALKGNAYDLTIFDSQMMSEFASGGHILLLNPFLEKSSVLQVKTYDAAALRTYAEYPENSGNLYALPLNQDTMGLAYRKDLFADPKEKSAFQAKYGYALAPPKDYKELKDIAAFFTRPDRNLYGIVLFGSENYDAVTSVFNNILWSYGAELWNPEANKVEGFINSPAAVAALDYFKDLFQYTPPGSTNWFWQEMNNAVINGRAAMAINWYYFFSAYNDPSINRYADRMGYVPLPGAKGPDRKYRQFNMVGGQGISISKYSSHPDEAWKFLEWLHSNETQWKWVRAGGQTGRIDILRSPDYLKANPYNAAFVKSMSRVKDYWRLVDYSKLLPIYQQYLHLAVLGKQTSKEALDNIAREQQALLSD